MTSRPAISFIREDIAGRLFSWDDRALTHYAHTHGLELVCTLVVPPNVADPILRLMNAARDAEAEVVIAPSLAHVNRGKRHLTEEWELHVVDTGSVWPRGHRWPGTIFLGEVNSNGAVQPRPER